MKKPSYMRTREQVRFPMQRRYSETIFLAEESLDDLWKRLRPKRGL